MPTPSSTFGVIAICLMVLVLTALLFLSISIYDAGFFEIGQPIATLSMFGLPWIVFLLLAELVLLLQSRWPRIALGIALTTVVLTVWAGAQIQPFT